MKKEKKVAQEVKRVRLLGHRRVLVILLKAVGSLLTEGVEGILCESRIKRIKRTQVSMHKRQRQRVLGHICTEKERGRERAKSFSDICSLGI